VAVVPADYPFGKAITVVPVMTPIAPVIVMAAVIVMTMIV
jgi:hypothetical protein